MKTAQLKQLVLISAVAAMLAACGGGGGSTAVAVPPSPVVCTATQVNQNGVCVTPPVTAITAPLPVFKTSYENKNSILLDNPKIPSVSNIKGLIREDGEQNFNLRAVAFADFMQDGSLMAMTVSTFNKNVYPAFNTQKWPDSPSKVYLLKQNTNGEWLDVTATLIKDSASRYICVTAGFIEIADFNNDGKPDAFVSCTGPDFLINGKFDDNSLQYVMLSQTDGTYRISILPIPPMYSHQSAAADFDGDGNVDIITVNPRPNERPFILFGNGDGTFRVDKTKFPADMTDKAIFGIMAVPVNGSLNVLVSGNAPGWTTSTLPGDYGFKVLQYKNGSFQYTNDLTSGIPKVTQLGTTYQLVLDAIYANGYYYTIWYDGTFQYSAIAKTNATTGLSTILAESKSGPNNSGPSMVIKLTSKNSIVSQMAACNQFSYTVGNYYYYECTYSIPIN